MPSVEHGNAKSLRSHHTKKTSLYSSLVPAFGAALILFGIWGWFALAKHTPSSEPDRVPSDFKPPFVISQDGRPVVMDHLMGYTPLSVSFTALNGQVINLDDDIVYAKVQEMLKRLNGPYRDELNGFLAQTTLAGNDPKRNFFLMVAGPEYPGIEHHPSGVAAASFSVVNDGSYLEIWIDGEVLASWEYLSEEDKVFTASSILHETRHLNDCRNYPEIQRRREAGWEALRRGRKMKPGPVRDKLVDTFIDGLSAQVLFEMLAYNDQFTWIEANSPQLAKQLAERDTPEIKPMFVGWKSGDRVEFALAVAEAYRSDMGQEDVPQDAWEGIKKDIGKWAAEDFVKIQQAVTDPVE